MRDVRSLDDVIAFVESTGSTCVIIFDVDNTLVPQGAPLAEFGELLNAAIDRVEAHPSIARVIPLTNGPQRDVLASSAAETSHGRPGAGWDFGGIERL